MGRSPDRHYKPRTGPPGLNRPDIPRALLSRRRRRGKGLPSAGEAPHVRPAAASVASSHFLATCSPLVVVSHLPVSSSPWGRALEPAFARNSCSLLRLPTPRWIPPHLPSARCSPRRRFPRPRTRPVIPATPRAPCARVPTLAMPGGGRQPTNAPPVPPSPRAKTARFPGSCHQNQN